MIGFNKVRVDFCYWLLATFSALCLGFSVTVQAASSQSYFKDAQKYIEKGDLKSAIIELKNALQEDPKDTQVRFLLGQTYLRLGDGAGAEKELERARRLGMPLQQVIIPLGRAYLMQGKADKVLTEIKPDNAFPADIKAGVQVLYANAYMLQRHKDKARKAIQEALRFDPNSNDALLAKARLAIVDKQLDEAQALSDRVRKAQPDNTEVWTIQGEISRLKGDLPTAKKNFEKAVRLNPANLTALLGSAGVNIALGDLATAKKQLETILRAAPEYPLANYLKAVLFYQEKDIAAAEQALQNVLRVAPNHLPSLQLMGAIDYSKGRLEQAEYRLARVVTAMPNNVPAVKLLAATRLKLKQADGAISVLEKALPEAQKDAQFLALLGTAYLQNGQVEKGTDYLERAVAAAPDAAGIRTQLALGRLATGDTAQAVKELESAVDLGHNVFQADVMLIMLHMRNKEYQKAVEQAQAFAKKLPTNPLPYNLMGTAYAGLRNTQMARKEFEEALKKDSQFVPAIMNLGRLDEDAGNLAAARKRYQAILKQHEGHLGALIALAKLAVRSGDEDQALKYYQAAWEENSGALEPGLVLVNYYNRKKQPMRAVGIARELKKVHPREPTAFEALGSSQMAAKDYSNAVATFEELVGLFPGSAQAHFLLGKAHLALDETAAAREQFNKSLAISKNHLPTQLAMADMEIKAKHPKAALAIARKIQKQRPEDAIGYRLQGNIYMSEGNYRAAIKAFDKAFDKTPSAALALASYGARSKAKLSHAYAPLENWLKSHAGDDAVRTVLASAYQKGSELRQAAEQYRIVLKRRPQDVVVLNNLAWVLHELNEPGAVKYAKQAYSLASKNPSVTDTYGWLLVQTGEVDRGLVLLQQAVIQAPQIAEIRFHLAVGLHRVGRDKEAIPELRRVLETSPDFQGADKARNLLAELEKK
jgi:putative PEP-CTERM system TPR-repeat lipoprotein